MSEPGRRCTVLGDDLLASTSSSAPSASSSTSKRQRVASGAGRSTAAAAAGSAGSAAAEPKVQVRQLQDALAALQQAEHDQACADASRAKALKKIQTALPAAEEMVRGATQTLLSAHQEAVPPPRSLRAEQADAQTRSNALAVDVRRAAGALAEHAYTGPSQPAVKGALASGRKFLAAVTQVSGHVGQLHAQRAANSSNHNDSRALSIRVLGIDQVRSAVLGSLSLRNLLAMCRTCRDFHRWAVSEVAALPPLLSNCLGSGICTITFTRGRPETYNSLEIDIPVDFAKGAEGTAITHGPGNHTLYLAGGGDDDEKRSMLRSVSVWRPSRPGELGGKWHALPPLPTRVTGATSCVVTMGNGEEVLAVVGGIHRDSGVESDDESDDDDSDDDETETLKVMVLSKGSWQPLAPVPIPVAQLARFLDAEPVYRTVALPNGRLAVVGADSECREVHVLDIEADSWSKLPDLTIARKHPLVVVRDQTMFVLGGLAPRGYAGGVPLFSCEKHTVGDDDGGGGGGGGGGGSGGGWTDCAAIPDWQEREEDDHAMARAHLVQDSLLVACNDGHSVIALRVYDSGTERWYSTEIKTNFSEQ
jgi:hypothetical protein